MRELHLNKIPCRLCHIKVTLFYHAISFHILQQRQRVTKVAMAEKVLSLPSHPKHTPASRYKSSQRPAVSLGDLCLEPID